MTITRPIFSAHHFSLLVLFLLSLSLAACSAGGSSGNGSRAAVETVTADLGPYVTAMKAAMPGVNSEGFVVPASNELATWRTLIGQLDAHNWKATSDLLAANFPSYRLRRVVDSGNGNAEYYVLDETTPVVKGWGAVMVNPAASQSLVIEVPHPVFDTHTDAQGLSLFRSTGAAYLLIAGAHRCANAAPSGCSGVSAVCGDGVYHESDAGHATATPFHVTHEAIAQAHPLFHFLSLHGNNDAVCGDWFLTAGSTTDEPAILGQLKQSFPVGSPLNVILTNDTQTCPHYGTTNVQGRFSNGSPTPCTASAPTTSGLFLHAEQSWNARTDPAYLGDIADALNAVF